MFAYILGLFCLHGWIIIYPRDTLQARHIALKVREKPVPSVRHGKTVTGRAGFGIKAIRGLAYTCLKRIWLSQSYATFVRTINAQCWPQ